MLPEAFEFRKASVLRRRSVGVAGASVDADADADADDGVLLPTHLTQCDDGRHVEEEKRPHRKQRREERVQADAVDFVVHLNSLGMLLKRGVYLLCVSM